MVEADMEHLRSKGQGIVPKGSKLEIRWNSKVGNGRLVRLALGKRGLHENPKSLYAVCVRPRIC